MQRILVTGGSGFIGTNLISELTTSQSHHRVLNIDVTNPRCPGQTEYWTECDVRDTPKLTALIREFHPNHVVHLAARTDLDEAAGPEGYSTNTEGTRSLIAALNGSSVTRCVFASSMLVCRNGYTPKHDQDYCPTTQYGRSKQNGEGIVRAADLGLTWAIVRPTSIWGPWFGVPYRDFFIRVCHKKYVHVGQVEVRKALGYVGNVVHQIVSLLNAAAGAINGKTFYLSDSSPVDIRLWADLIADTAGVRRPIAVPRAALALAARIGDLRQTALRRRAPLTTFRLRNMCTSSQFDMSEMMRIAGPQRYGIEEGVRVTLAWLRAMRYV